MNETIENLPWRKSLASGASDCVIVAAREGVVYVANSKNPTVPAICFTASEWDAFIVGVKLGEFDFSEGA